MDIRIAGTEYSLQYRSFEIYVQGCYRHCPDCHNPETQPPCGGTEVNAEEWIALQKEKTDKFDSIIKRVYMTGGDLLCNYDDIAIKFSALVSRTWDNKEIWLFTGAKKEELPDWVFKYYDIIKFGEYDKTKRQEGVFPASSNQGLIINARMGSKKVIEVPDFKGEIVWK